MTSVLQALRFSQRVPAFCSSSLNIPFKTASKFPVQPDCCVMMSASLPCNNVGTQGGAAAARLEKPWPGSFKGEDCAQSEAAWQSALPRLLCHSTGVAFPQAFRNSKIAPKPQLCHMDTLCLGCGHKAWSPACSVLHSPTSYFLGE